MFNLRATSIKFCVLATSIINFEVHSCRASLHVADDAVTEMFTRRRMIGAEPNNGATKPFCTFIFMKLQ